MFIYIKMDAECNETWGAHPADERGCEVLSSRGNHMRTPEIYQKSSKSMILKTNQDTYGDFLRHGESPGMRFDTTRLHKT